MGRVLLSGLLGFLDGNFNFLFVSCCSLAIWGRTHYRICSNCHLSLGSWKLPKSPLSLHRFTQYRAKGLLLGAAYVASALSLGLAPSLLARSGTGESNLTITTEQELQFGQFAVTGTGYREVLPNGVVRSSGSTSFGRSGARPARITIRYDRGSNETTSIKPIIHLVISPPPAVQVGGKRVRLGQIQTDLPNAGIITPGAIVEVPIPNCRVRVCEKTFSLGARLYIDDDLGGAEINIPIPIDAVLVDLEK